MNHENICFLTRPFQGESVSGDVGVIVELGDIVFLGLADVLGHGESASRTAQLIKTFLETNASEDLGEVLNHLHEYMREYQGAVAAFCTIDTQTGSGCYAGAGNIGIRQFGSTRLHAFTKGGILGQTLPSLPVKPLQLCLGDVLILYSDGVKDHFALADDEPLFSESADTIAKHIIDSFSRPLDDVSCLVYVHKP